MAEFTRDQFCFSTGELSPKVQGRTDWVGYYKGAKQLRDCLVIPQGGIRSRWGTIYVDTATVVQNNFLYCEISTLVYDGIATYLLVWENASLKIYLENVLVATVVTTYAATDIPNLRFVQVQNRLVVTNFRFAQRQLQRAANAANQITGFVAPNSLTITNALTVGQILPATFTTTVTLPVTTPQIVAGVTYYVLVTGANAISIYSTPQDAASNSNVYTVTNAGAGVNNLFVQNTWTISDIVFKNVPSYDFTAGYSAITFTPSATSGNITLTASGNIFTAAMVGGIYTGNGGSIRLTAFTDATHMDGYTVLSFPNTNAIQGNLSFLGEPVWSAARGYPRTCGFFEQRLYFGGTQLVSNGIWGSVVNDVYNFDDSETLADNAISYYPADGIGTSVLSFTSGPSLIVHTDTGSYSTPYTNSEVPLTPTNFILKQKSKYGVSTIQPVFIDNQIIFVNGSGNNVMNMVWRVDQQSFVTDNISVYSDTLIVSPQDMAAIPEPNATNGFYVFFVNSDGTLAVFQTLFEEGIAAWSLCQTSTVFANYFDNIAGIPIANRSANFPASFVRVTSSNNRCWFTISRTTLVDMPSINITGFSSLNNTLTANAHGLPLNVPSLVFFTGANLPNTNPTLKLQTFYWVVATDVNTFSIYLGYNNAAVFNGIKFDILSSGIGATVTPQEMQNRLYIEELSFNVDSDSSAIYKSNVPITNVTGLNHLKGCNVQIATTTKTDANFASTAGIIFIFNGTLAIPQAYQDTEIKIGTQFISTFTPLPITIPQVEGLLYKNKHIRSLYVRYYQSEGIRINGFAIPEIEVPALGDINLQDGVYLSSPMNDWETIDQDIIITQPFNLPMTILGLSYIIEV